MPIVRPIRVHESETVEIQWTCHDGTIFHQRVTIPPQATREVRQSKHICSCGTTMVCPDIGCDENKSAALATEPT